MNGTPIHVVRDVLGHSNIKQTAEYAFTNEEAMREAVVAVGGASRHRMA